MLLLLLHVETQACKIIRRVLPPCHRMPFPNRAYLDENVVTGDDVDLGADTNLLAALFVSHLLARVSFPHKHEH